MIHLVSTDLRKEVTSIISERESKKLTIQTLEHQIHHAEMDLNNKKQKVKERQGFDSRKEESKAEIVKLEENAKVCGIVACFAQTDPTHVTLTPQLNDDCRLSTSY